MVVLLEQQLGRVPAVINPQLARCWRVLGRVPVGRFRAVAAALLLVYCCHVVARLFWHVLPLPQLEQPTPEQLLQWRPQTIAHGTAPVDIDGLKALHLFGDPDGMEPVASVASLPEIAVEETRLDLRLLGVVVSDVESADRAVIAHRNHQELYALGDKLPGGSQVSLAQVLPGRVIINNNSRYEALWLYEDKQAAAEPPASRASAIPVVSEIVPEPTRSPERIKPAVAATPGKTVTEPGSLADIIQFTPVHADGRILGYRIAPGRAPQWFERFGLKKNDVITSVNGIALDDASKSLKVYRQIQGAQAASFELVRDGKTQLIEVQLDVNRSRG